MGVKSFFQKLFGGDSGNKNAQQARLLNGSPNECAIFSGEFYANSLVRSIVHRIATYASMISFEHVRGYGTKFEKMESSAINRLLNVRPNEFMTPSEMQYKTWTDLLITNNAYQWLKRDRRGAVIAILPVVAGQTEFVEIDGFPFYRFTFSQGERIVVPASDIVHLRQYYYRNDVFGDDNTPLREDLGLVNTLRVSVDAALKNGAQIKGILKHQNTIDPEDLAKHEKLFRESYLKASNSGGIGMLDAKFDFIPLNYQGKITDSAQMKEIRDYVYRYFGINDEIIMSNYTSDQWQSYYESRIAPILNEMSQSYTIHAFTDKEIGYGNRLIPSVNMVTFMSATQKISMVKLALDGALYTRNEIRQWFGDSPVEGGDTYQYSKNFTEDTGANKEETPGKGKETDGENGADAADNLPDAGTE